MPRGNGPKEINAGMSGLIDAPFMVSLSPPVPLYFALWHVQDEIVGKLTTIAAYFNNKHHKKARRPRSFQFVNVLPRYLQLAMNAARILG